MKLSIDPMAPARVVIPVRLHIRAEDLPAYQAATLSHRTFVDATLDLGPEDFPSDRARLAARDLAALLRSENTRDSHHCYDSDGKPVVAGMLVIEIAYPFDEADIRQAAIDLVGATLVQRDFVASAFTAFDPWTKQVESAFRTTTKALLKTHKKALAQFEALQSRRKVAVKQLERDELQSFVTAYRDLAREFPCEDDLQSALAHVVPSENLPFQAKYLTMRLHSSHWMSVFSMDHSATTRTASSEPSVTIAIHVIGADNSIMDRKPSLGCRMTVEGSLIERQEKTVDLEFSDLEPLMAAVYQVQEDWGKYGKHFDEDRIPGDIVEAFKRIEAKAIADEMAAWIMAHGSPSLKLGHEQGFSMTRQYRFERGQSVLSNLLKPYPGWGLVLAGDFADGTRSAEKASPSARALNVLVGLKGFAPGATIRYSASLTEEILPEDGEYLWLPEDQCFPDAPGVAICWPLPAPMKKGPKRRP